MRPLWEDNEQANYWASCLIEVAAAPAHDVPPPPPVLPHPPAPESALVLPAHKDSPLTCPSKRSSPGCPSTHELFLIKSPACILHTCLGSVASMQKDCFQQLNTAHRPGGATWEAWDNQAEIGRRQ